MNINIVDALKTVIYYCLTGKLWYIDVALIYLSIMVYITGAIEKIVYTTTVEARDFVIKTLARFDVSALTVFLCSIIKALDGPMYWVIIAASIGMIQIKYPWLSGIVDYTCDIKIYPESENNSEGDDKKED